MTSHDEGIQAQSSDQTETPQSNHTQNNSEEIKETQANKHESQSAQRKSQGRDYEQENNNGKDKVKKQEESNDEHDNNKGKEGSEKEGSQQQSGEGKSGNGNGNGGSKHPKVSKEALEGPQSPAPTTKYDFEAEARNGTCCWSIFITSLHQANRYQMVPVKKPVKMKLANPRIRRTNPQAQMTRKTSLPSTSMAGHWDI